MFLNNKRSVCGLPAQQNKVLYFILQNKTLHIPISITLKLLSKNNVFYPLFLSKKLFSALFIKGMSQVGKKCFIKSSIDQITFSTKIY